MNKLEKISIAVGTAACLFLGVRTFAYLYYLRDENTRLKIDNINLLRNSFIALDALSSGRPIPPPIVEDFEFRRMAFVSEFEDIEDEPNG